MEKRPSQTYTLSLLLMNICIAFLGISLVIPVMPTIMNELHISGTVVGYLVAAFAFTQLIFSPIAGRMADQIGRKPMIVIGLFLFAISEVLFGIGNTVEILFVSRILGGTSASFVMPAVTAYIADITSLKTRPKALGYMSAAISTGFIIGPAIGGFLADFGHRIPFFTAAGLGGFASCLSFISLREPERNPENKTGTIQRDTMKKVFTPLFLIPFVIIFITSFGLASFESLFSLFVDHKFGFTPRDIAIMITGGAIIGAVAQIFLFDRMTIHWGEIRLIRYSLLVSATLVFFMTVVDMYLTIMIVTFTVFIGFDLLRPAITNYLSNIAGDEQGFVGGMNSMFTSLGNVFGPIVGGILFDIDLNYPFYFATVIIAFGIFLTIFWEKPKKKVPEHIS
ncbi:MFS transporter [Fervidibacillus halotolerans]|uniref:MFS transporter n=1 Tax=Fervidibacillus halotolerans TaxID=2980027 RepID=A0A9E8M1U2_9BACI|nr:MFS transporter [Fervidibacillus halotolerans]WAA12881.1 MFS transporter [Fervidibacillus halotolerans]